MRDNVRKGRCHKALDRTKWTRETRYASPLNFKNVEKTPHCPISRLNLN